MTAHPESAPKAPPAESPRRSILFNIAWSTFHTLLSKAIRFVAIAYCIRQLGAHTWGQIAAATVTVGFLYFAVDQGLGMVPTLHKVGERALDRIFLLRIAAYRFAMAVAVVGALRLVHAAGFPMDRLVLLYSLTLLPRALNMDWWFQRRELYHYIGALATFRVLVFTVGAAFLVKAGGTAELVLSIDIAAELAAVAAGYLLYRRNRDPAQAPAAEAAASLPMTALARMGHPFLFMGLLTTIHQSVDILFLKYMCGYRSVGEYDVGYRIGFFAFFVGAGVIQVIRPKLARLYQGGDTASIAPILASCSKILAALACGFVIVSFYFSEPLVALIFKDQGRLTPLVFRWVSVWVAIAFMTMLCADTLLCLGRKRKYLIGAVLCAVGNVAGNYVLILGFGDRGAIFATILSESIFLVYAYSQLPAAIRLPLTRSLVPQGLALAALVAGYLASTWFGAPMAFFAGSLMVLAVFVVKEGLLHKSTLSVLARN